MTKTAQALATRDEMKLTIMGAGATGKSSLTMQYVSHSFVENYDPSIEDLFRRQNVVDDRAVLLDITDTAGQEEYSAMREQYMRDSDGFMFVYSTTDRATFDELSLFAEQLSRVQDCDVQRVPLVVVGNKIDLVNERAVTTGEGQDFAKSLGALFIETSAKTRFNVDECFADLVREVRRSKARAAASQPSAPARPATARPAYKKRPNVFKRLARKLHLVKRDRTNLRDLP